MLSVAFWNVVVGEHIIRQLNILPVIYIVLLLGLVVFSFYAIVSKQKLKLQLAQLQRQNESLEVTVAQNNFNYRKISEELIETTKNLDQTKTLLINSSEQYSLVKGQLEINEGKYRGFIEQSGDGIAIINNGGKIGEWNKKMEEISGFLKKDIINTDMWEVEYNMLPLSERTPERQQSLKMKYLMDLSQIEMKEPFVHEEEIYNNHKETKKIMSVIFPILTSQGNFVGCITRDISREMSQKENEFAAKLLQLVQNLVIVLDTAGKIIKFNYAFELLTGYTKDEVQYKYFWEIIKPRNKRELTEQVFSDFVKNGVPPEINDIITTKTGECRNILWKFNSINDEHGNYDHLIFSGTDITEIRQKEEALMRSEQKFRQIFEKTLTGFLLYEPIFDDNGQIYDIRYIKANPSLREQTGIIPEEVIGKTYRQLYGEDDLIFINEYNTYKKEGRYVNYEEYIPRANRYFRIQHFELSPGLMALTFDNVTEQKLMEQKLIETVINIEERGHKRIARDLHDEVGPQLASMNVYISSLYRKIENPEQREILQLLKDLVKDSISQIREISNNLTPNVIEKYGMIAALNSEIDSIKLIVPVSFDHHIDNERFDSKIEMSIYRIIKELLNNTKKYAEAKKVEITINKSSTLIFVTYYDDGNGFNLKKKLKTGDLGMGLLNIESRIKALRGKFFMKSEPSKGFMFSMEIPVNTKSVR